MRKCEKERERESKLESGIKTKIEIIFYMAQ